MRKKLSSKYPVPKHEIIITIHAEKLSGDIICGDTNSVENIFGISEKTNPIETSSIKLIVKIIKSVNVNFGKGFLGLLYKR